MPRLRTSRDPRAYLRGRLPDAELVDAAPTFLPAPAYWRVETVEAYAAFQDSPAARALRREDLPGVLRLFVYLDALAGRLEKLAAGDRKVLRQITTLETVITRLGRDRGYGPAARVALGIPNEEPVSRFASFA